MGWIELGQLIRDKFRKQPLEIECGGTGSGDLQGARQGVVPRIESLPQTAEGIVFGGYNLFTGEDGTIDLSEDTPAFWAKKGCCITYFATADIDLQPMIKKQPTRYGFVHTYVSGNIVTQIWYQQDNSKKHEGTIYRRSGNATSDWYRTGANMWVPLNHDFVVESGTLAIEGTSDYTGSTWYWQIWSSGKAECWSEGTIKVKLTKTWGSTNLYTSDEYYGTRPLPLEFLREPVAIPYLRKSNDDSTNHIMVTTGNNGSTTRTPSIRLVSPVQKDTEKTYNVGWYVTGQAVLNMSVNDLTPEVEAPIEKVD